MWASYTLKTQNFRQVCCPWILNLTRVPGCPPGTTHPNLFSAFSINFHNNCSLAYQLRLPLNSWLWSASNLFQSTPANCVWMRLGYTVTLKGARKSLPRLWPQTGRTNITLRDSARETKGYFEQEEEWLISNDASIKDQKKPALGFLMSSTETSANSDAVETNLIAFVFRLTCQSITGPFVVHLRKGMCRQGAEKPIYHWANTGQCVNRTCYSGLIL